MRVINFVLIIFIFSLVNMVKPITFSSELKKAVTCSRELLLINSENEINEIEIRREKINYFPEFSVSLRTELFDKRYEGAFYSWKYSYWKKSFENNIDVDGVYNLTKVSRNILNIKLLELKNSKNILSYVYKYKEISKSVLEAYKKILLSKKYHGYWQEKEKVISSLYNHKKRLFDIGELKKTDLTDIALAKIEALGKIDEYKNELLENLTTLSELTQTSYQSSDTFKDLSLLETNENIRHKIKKNIELELISEELNIQKLKLKRYYFNYLPEISLFWNYSFKVDGEEKLPYIEKIRILDKWSDLGKIKHLYEGFKKDGFSFGLTASFSFNNIYTNFKTRQIGKIETVKLLKQKRLLENKLQTRREMIQNNLSEINIMNLNNQKRSKLSNNDLEMKKKLFKEELAAISEVQEAELNNLDNELKNYEIKINKEYLRIVSLIDFGQDFSKQ